MPDEELKDEELPLSTRNVDQPQLQHIVQLLQGMVVSEVPEPERVVGLSRGHSRCTHS